MIDSRPISDGIRRRRECLACERRFTTHERVAAVEMRVVKVPGRPAEEFQSEKLLRAIRRVCRQRPVSTAQMEAIARQIEAELVDSGRTSVRSSEIAQVLLAKLELIDLVAHHRFASNYVLRDGRVVASESTSEVPEQYPLFGADSHGSK